MSETKHTPGPWAYTHDDDGRSDGYIRAGELYGGAMHPPAIARICKRGYGASIGENDANARLIAAAPELLEALRELTYLASGMNDRQHAGFTLTADEWADVYETTNRARALIAKATGRAS